MCRFECRHDLHGQAYHFLDAERTVQRSALHVLEHQIAGADIVDLANVRMIQRRNRPGLLLEAADAIRVGGKRLGEDLDRHVTTKTRVARTIHFAHAAGADQRDDFIRADLRAQCEWHVRGGQIISAPRTRTRALCYSVIVAERDLRVGCPEVSVGRAGSR